jgi:hypothetical protein
LLHPDPGEKLHGKKPHFAIFSNEKKNELQWEINIRLFLEGIRAAIVQDGTSNRY